MLLIVVMLQLMLCDKMKDRTGGQRVKAFGLGGHKPGEAEHRTHPNGSFVLPHLDWATRVKREGRRASLVAQWLRICLPMQGTWVRALVWEDPTCRRAAGPVSHNY